MVYCLFGCIMVEYAVQSNHRERERVHLNRCIYDDEWESHGIGLVVLGPILIFSENSSARRNKHICCLMDFVSDIVGNGTWYYIAIHTFVKGCGKF